MSSEELAKALYEAAPDYRFEHSAEDAWPQHIPIPWSEASEHAQDRSFALARAANKFYGIAGEPEEGGVRKARARLRLIIDKAAGIPELRRSQDVYREVTMLVSHAKSALRALGGKAAAE